MVNKRVHTVLEMLDLKADPEVEWKILAQYAIDNFGKGGNPEATHPQEYIGWRNTTMFGPYFTTEIDAIFGQALEMIGATAKCKLIRVEWTTDEAGAPIVYEPITYEVEDTNLDTGEVAFRQQPIGRIAN